MKRHLACALALVVGCAACGGGGESAESTTTSDQTTSSSSTSSSSTTSSTLFIFNENPPPLENQGEDFEAILTSLFEYRAWLLANPDLELVSLVFEPGNPLFDSVTSFLTEDIEGGRFTAAPGAELPSEVTVSDRPDDNTVALVITKPELGYTVTNNAGVVFEDVPPGPDATFVYELRRTDDRWRIASLRRID